MSHCHIVTLSSPQFYTEEAGLTFIKIHGPWSVLSAVAVQLNSRAPIQVGFIFILSRYHLYVDIY